MIGINEMYSANHKISSYGIEGYAVQKKYQDGNYKGKHKNDKESKEEQKRKETKRGHYLEDHQKIHGPIPGPTDYQTSGAKWPVASKSSKMKLPQAKKLTIIGQIFAREKKEQRPAPGQYKIFKDDKEIQAEKKRLASRRVSHTDRMTYLDAVQYEASNTPGVGSYNTIQRPKSANFLKKNKKSLSRPEIVLKKKQSGPGIGSYNPKVEQHKSFSRKKKGYSEWGKAQRFKNSRSGSTIGPGAYLRGDEDKSVVRRSTKSIYY